MARMKDNIDGLNALQSDNQGEGRDQGDDQAEDGKTKKEGTNWNKKALGRRQWKALMEGYILQPMDKA